MNHRQLSFKYYYKLANKRFALMGTFFVLTSVFLLLPFTVFINNTFPEEYTQSYNEVFQKGRLAQAKVLAIEEVEDMTINNRHPLKFSLLYKDLSGNESINIFATIDRRVADTIKTGAIVPVKVFNDKVGIIGMESVGFPVSVFYSLPGVFFILGSIFCFKGFYPVF